jgi:hypothetical protein
MTHTSTGHDGAAGSRLEQVLAETLGSPFDVRARFDSQGPVR